MNQTLSNANTSRCPHKKKGIKKHIHSGVLTATTYCKKCGAVIDEKTR